jgi:hypothetical protein
MLFYRGRLPHWVPDSSILFLTWRLAGSLPAPRADPRMPQHGAPVSFVQQDERLARSSSGPFWLRDPRVASMVQQALRYRETPRNLYFLHPWVILPMQIGFWEEEVNRFGRTSLTITGCAQQRSGTS